jgi:hypothetical protein
VAAAVLVALALAPPSPWTQCHCPALPQASAALRVPLAVPAANPVPVLRVRLAGVTGTPVRDRVTVAIQARRIALQVDDLYVRKGIGSSTLQVA